MADYNSDRTGSNIDSTLDKVDALDAKVQPTATGVDVTGTVTADGLSSDGNIQAVGAGNTRTIGFDFYGSSKYNLHVDGTVDADKMLIRRGTTNVANFGANGDVSFYEDTGTTAKMVWDASAESLGIGTSSPSAKLDVVGDINVSGGVYLGGTGAANKLDDYETGTWTPVLKFGGLDTGITYNELYRTCTYTKVGRVVTLRFGIRLTSKGTDTGTATIEGLPFTVKSLAYRDATCTLGYGGMTGLSTAGLLGIGRNNGTILDLGQNGDSAVVIVNDTKFSNSTFMYGTFVYDTDQ